MEENDDAGEGWVRERMAWGRGGGRKFFRVERRVREHSCLTAQVSSLIVNSFNYSNREMI